MKPLCAFPASQLAQIRFFLTDIDDTLTTEGTLPSSSLRAMEDLTAAGVHVIPVTGRPAGWCDHIARMWPVDAVVGENGALYFSYDREAKKMRTWFARGEEAQEQDRKALLRIGREVLQKVPGTALASDQKYRLTDLAIDFCEDVPRLPDREIARIVSILEESGATTKVSSIHVNSWFGSHDKLTTSQRCLKDLYGVSETEIMDKTIYVGDSPNDEPMFARFKHAIGVANVRDMPLKYEPTWVTEGKSAEGFAQIAKAIIVARKELENDGKK